MQKELMLYLLLPVFVLTAETALAGGDAAAGEQKSQACQVCHGADGRGADPSFPVLAGQHASYLVRALTDYRNGKRKNAVMGGFAASLSDQDIRDLAAWYASLEGLRDLSLSPGS
jgi:cytochrome c553